MGRVAAALASTLLAACFIKPDGPLPASGDRDAGGSSDADALPTDALVVDPCAPFTFDQSGPGCGYWSSTTILIGTSPSIGRDGDHLVLGAETDVASRAACGSPTRPFSGFGVKIVAVPNSTLGEANIFVNFDGDDLRIRIGGSTTSVKPATASTTLQTVNLGGWDATKQYLRVMPANFGVNIQWSPDRMSWTPQQFLQVSGSNAMASLVLDMQTAPPGGGPVFLLEVRYDEIELCL